MPTPLNEEESRTLAAILLNSGEPNDGHRPRDLDPDDVTVFMVVAMVKCENCGISHRVLSMGNLPIGSALGLLYLATERLEKLT